MLATEDSPPHGAPEGAAAPCDPRALARLRKWGGEKLVREMVQIFLAQVPERVTAARQGIGASDPVEIERAAHALKSSCGQLGAVRMQVLCATIESLAARGNLSPIPEMLDALENEFGRYLHWVSTATQDVETPG